MEYSMNGKFGWRRDEKVAFLNECLLICFFHIFYFHFRFTLYIVCVLLAGMAGAH